MRYGLGSGRRRRPLSRLLLDAVDDDTRGVVPGGGYAGVTSKQLADAMQLHKVGPAVYVHLKGSGDVPASLIEVARRRYTEQTVRQLRARNDLAIVVEVLSGIGVSWVAVKGPVLADQLWPRPDLRQYSDLDIVVDQRRVGEVIDALCASGAQLVDRNWIFLRDRLQGELSLRLLHGTDLDLHWHLVNDQRLRQVFRFPMDAMRQRAVEVNVSQLSVPTLDPVDTLLHLAYHTAHSGGHRLVWLKDVQYAASVANLDWDIAIARARKYGMLVTLGVVLARVSRTVGLAEAVPRAARRSMWSAWSAVAGGTDLVWPAPKLPFDRLSGQIVYKSTRASTGGSALAGVKAVTRWSPHASAPTDNVLHVEAGGAAEREQFLAAIATEATT